MKVVKSVEVPYTPTEEIMELLTTFRNMINHCIRIGLETGITSRYKLSGLAYKELRRYKFHSHYYIASIEVAIVILKNYRKAKRKKPNTKIPRAKRLMAKLDHLSYKITENKIRIPIKPRKYIYISLHEYATKILSKSDLTLASITLTTKKIIITYSKEVEPQESKGYIAFDVNEGSLDGAYIQNGKVKTVKYDLKENVKIKHGYFERKRKVQSKYSRDRRVTKKILRRYSRNRNNKIDTKLHQISAEVVKQAKAKGQGIILEDLSPTFRNWINRKIRTVKKVKGKTKKISHGKQLKRRLNNWGFRKLQDTIAYKAEWEGIEVIYADPYNTSRECAVCGQIMKDPKAQTLECHGLDRHVNACLNLLKTQDETLRFRVDRSVIEAVTSPLNKAKSRNGKANQC